MDSLFFILGNTDLSVIRAGFALQKTLSLIFQLPDGYVSDSPLSRSLP